MRDYPLSVTPIEFSSRFVFYMVEVVSNLFPLALNRLLQLMNHHLPNMFLLWQSWEVGLFAVCRFAWVFVFSSC